MPERTKTAKHVKRKSQYDLLALDLDGTLLNSRHELPTASRAALHRAHETGMRIVLCTGRSYPETCPVLDDLGLDLDAAVTVFGALLTDVRTGRTMERVPMALPLAYRLTDWFRARGFTVLWLTDVQQAGSDGYVIDGQRRHPAVDRWVQQSPCQVACVAELPGDAYSPLRVSIIDEPAALVDVSADLGREFGGQLAHNLLRAPVYDLTIIETFAPGVNKWRGIERLCQRWGLAPNRTVAVGDDVNDVDMVRCAGLGVAMADAHPDVKRAARRVIGSNDTDALARFVDELLGP